MSRKIYISLFSIAVALGLWGGISQAEDLPDRTLQDDPDRILAELVVSPSNPLEELVGKSSPRSARQGIASYYASRFIGRRTTSGHRYDPEKMTAAHYSLPLGTV